MCGLSCAPEPVEQHLARLCKLWQLPATWQPGDLSIWAALTPSVLPVIQGTRVRSMAPTERLLLDNGYSNQNNQRRPRASLDLSPFQKDSEQQSDLSGVLQGLPADASGGNTNLPPQASLFLIPSISSRGTILHTRVVTGS